jgi:hypothetical protein
MDLYVLAVTILANVKVFDDGRLLGDQDLS